MSSICAECGSQVLDLALHMKIHSDKNFGYKHVLERHTKEIHEKVVESSIGFGIFYKPVKKKGLSLYQCDQCPLHVNLLGCGNDVLECLEKFYPRFFILQMSSSLVRTAGWYTHHAMLKFGTEITVT